MAGPVYEPVLHGTRLHPLNTQKWPEEPCLRYRALCAYLHDATLSSYGCYSEGQSREERLIERIPPSTRVIRKVKHAGK